MNFRILNIITFILAHNDNDQRLLRNKLNKDFYDKSIKKPIGYLITLQRLTYNLIKFTFLLSN